MTAPKLPTSIKIGAYTYDVGVRETADEGSFVHETQHITVAPNRGEDATADCLLHESLHAMFAILGFRKAAITDKQEEHIVSALSPLLLQTLRDNPKLVDFLVA